MRELHLTEKDFKLDWFSGTGAGGQHRNKTQNCCRITHIETGLTAVGQTERSRVANQAKAFKHLVSKLMAHYAEQDKPVRFKISSEVIRNYHAERNEVLDKASNFRQTYTEVVEKGEIAKMVSARKQSLEAK